MLEIGINEFVIFALDKTCVFFFVSIQVSGLKECIRLHKKDRLSLRALEISNISGSLDGCFPQKRGSLASIR